MKEQIPVDIWGTCVSRDIFGITNPLDFKVKNYLWSVSFVSAFSKYNPVTGTASIEDVDDTSSFLKRMRCHEINKTALEVFEEPSGILIADIRYTIYGITEFLFDDGSNLLVTRGSKNQVEQVLNDKGIQFTKKDYKADDDRFSEYFDKFTEFCKKKYRTIILVEALESLTVRTEDGLFKPASGMEFDANVELERKFNERFLKDTGCHVVRCPPNIYSDNRHKWGPGPVHYPDSFYRYAIECIRLIVGGGDTSSERDRLYERLHSRIKDEITGATTVMTNPEEPPTAEEALLLGRKYLKGTDCTVDVDKAEHYFRLYSESDPASRHELADLLWKKGDKDSIDEMIRIVSAEGITDSGSMCRLARAYHRGRGVEKDLAHAENIIKECLPNVPRWSVLELFDILWEEGKYSEMISLITPYVEMKDAHAMGRLARAYAAGVGVDKDIAKAKELYRPAVDRKIDWAVREYGQL